MVEPSEDVEISSNPGGVGFWIWAELGPGRSLLTRRRET
jgi:hypothetical protein